MSDLIRYENWNKWTEKSKDVKFSSSTKGVGDGEYKIASEYNTVPSGQNVSFDLLIKGEEWECKKLDDDNSFRLGVEIDSQYISLVTHLLEILNKVKRIIPLLVDDIILEQFKEIDTLVTSTSKKCKTSLYEGLLKSEVSSSNLRKADIIIEKIKSVVNSVTNLTKFINDPLHTETISVPIGNYFMILKLSGKSDEEIKERLKCNYNIAVVKFQFEELISVYQSTSLQERLNRMVQSIFENKVLVLVEEEKGYMPIKNVKTIFCNRITSGRPRCKFINK